MKKHLYHILAGVLLLLVCSQCKKKVADRRNKYTGTWQFHYPVRSLSMGSPEITTTGEYSGKVFYDGRKDKKAVLHIQFAEDWDETFELDKNGSLTQCEKRGQFDSENSITLVNTSVSCHTRLAGEVSYTLSGTR